MLDRRKEQRRPAYLGGTISFNKRLSEADCTVRNTSEHGARLELRTPLVPNEFDLVIPKRQAQYRMRVMWRRDRLIGVEMADRHLDEQDVSLAQSQRLELLEQDNKNLRHRLGLSDLW